jgi:hypothetical protein
MEELDGDVAMQRDVLGQENLGRSADSQGRDESVSPS